MVDPIYSTLGTLLSNTIQLVGGVVMCFITSWRLSMLAFTTILPMMHVTGVYAEWSGTINRQIYQHLSDAMSRMGEVRTRWGAEGWGCSVAAALAAAWLQLSHRPHACASS
jgi:ABC-type multidrug transport system fused ATPase/permease subunit